MKTDKLESYFNEAVEKEEMGGCWIWLGSYRFLNKYPRMFHNGSYVQATKVGYLIQKGSLSKIDDFRLRIFKICSNDKCVKPSHMTVVKTKKLNKLVVKN